LINDGQGRVHVTGGYNPNDGYTVFIDTYSIGEDSWLVEDLGVELTGGRAFHIAEAVPEENLSAC